MPRAAPGIVSFNAGEWPPRARGRVDLDKYRASLRTLQSFVPTIQGAAIKRSGTRHLIASPYGDSQARLIPFQFNATDAHVLHLGPNLITFFTDGGAQLEAPVAISGATQADPVVVTATAHGFQNADVVYIDGVVGMTQLNGKFYRAASVTTNTLELQDLDGNDIDGTGYTSYTSDGEISRLYTIASPYTSTDLPDLDWYGSGDVLYLAHPDHAPRKLSRLGNASWTLEEIEFERPPFNPENIDEDVYMVASSATGNPVVTWTAGQFTADHVGAYIRLNSRFVSNMPEWAATITTSDLGGAGYLDANGTLWYEDNVYEVVTRNGHGATGTAPPVHKMGSKSDGHWTLKFLNNGSGYVQITSIIDATRAQTTVVRELPEACVDSALTISTISNATPPVVTTTVSHGYETGDKVWIDGVSGSASVFNQGVFTITDTGASTFTLDGQVASGAGTGGYAQRVATGDSSNYDIGDFKDHDLWSLSAFNEFDGYPRAVTIFEDRLIWAGTRSHPHTLWGSKTGEYEDHTQSSVTDEGSLVITLATGDPIVWLRQQNSLMIGLSGGEFASIRDGEPLAPSTIHQIRSKSSYGTRQSVRPLLTENQVLIAQRSGRELREIRFDVDSGDFSGENLALLAEHLTVGSIAEMVFQEQPDRVVWIRLDNGSLRSMTYERGQQVVGWSRHVLGGAGVAVESMAVIPDPTGVRDELYLIVKRTINSVTRRYVEKMEPLWTGESAIADGIFLDSALTYSGAGSYTLTGLEHLEGESVGVLIDGVELPVLLTVSGGDITIPTYPGGPPTKANAGLPYNADLETQDIEAGSATGVAAGKMQKIQDVVFRLLETGAGLQYGPSLESVDRQTLSLSEGQLFSGDTGHSDIWPSGHGRNTRIAIRHGSPLPCTVVALFPRITTQD